MFQDVDIEIQVRAKKEKRCEKDVNVKYQVQNAPDI